MHLCVENTLYGEVFLEKVIDHCNAFRRCVCTVYAQVKHNDQSFFITAAQAACIPHNQKKAYI